MNNPSVIRCRLCGEWFTPDEPGQQYCEMCDPRLGTNIPKPEGVTDCDYPEYELQDDVNQMSRF